MLRRNRRQLNDIIFCNRSTGSAGTGNAAAVCRARGIGQRIISSLGVDRGGVAGVGCAAAVFLIEIDCLLTAIAIETEIAAGVVVKDSSCWRRDINI